MVLRAAAGDVPMGTSASQCKCECLGKDDETNPSGLPSPTQWDEVVSSRQASALDSPPQTIIPSARGESLPASPAKAPLDAPAKAPVSPVYPPEVAARSRKLIFELEAAKTLGVRFVDVKVPQATGDDGTVAVVVNTIAEKSALSATTTGEPGINPGDVVLEVNGQNNAKANLLDLMQEARTQGGKLEMVVCSRPKTFSIELVRPDPNDKEFKMGLVVAVHDDVSDKLEVRHVCDDGALFTWNEKNAFHHVCSGDWVCSVDGPGSAGAKSANAMIGDMQKIWSQGHKLILEIQTDAPAMTK